MSKVFGMHMLALKPGVKAKDFEKYVTEEIYPHFLLEGCQFYLLKGDRGDREGRYLALYEFESVERRDHYFPSPGAMSKEVQKLFETYGAVIAKWETLATPLDVISTDYVVVGK